MNILNFEKMLRDGELRCHIVPLEPGVYGYTYKSRKRYHVFINEQLSPGGRHEVLMHELFHIANDMPETAYILGLDKQSEHFEKNAVKIARKVLQKR